MSPDGRAPLVEILQVERRALAASLAEGSPGAAAGGPARTPDDPVAVQHEADVRIAAARAALVRLDEIEAVGNVPPKLTLVGRSDFTAAAESELHYVHVRIAGDSLDAHAIAPDGRVVDAFTLRHRR